MLGLESVMARNWELEDLPPKMRDQAREQLGMRAHLPVPFTLHLPMELLSRNEIDKLHWADRGRLRGRYQEAVAALGYGHVRPLPFRASLTIRRIMGPRQRPWDEDNLAGGSKQLIDALVRCGWFEDDSPQWIVMQWVQDGSRRAEGPTVELRVEEAGTDGHSDDGAAGSVAGR